MADFEMEFELTGLKVKIKSDRAQVPQALAAAQGQLTSMMQSAASLASGKLIEGGSSGKETEPRQSVAASVESPSGKRSPAKRSRSRTEPTSATPMDFKHDAERFGYPMQEWNTVKKCLWLLYVLGEQTDAQEASAPALLATFNKHFKQFGPLNPKNVGRDLGNYKGKANHLGSDTTKDPQVWYLLEGGKAEGLRLIQQSKAEKDKQA